MYDTGDLFDVTNEDHGRFVRLLAEIEDYGKKTAEELGFPAFFFSIEKKTPKSGVNYPIFLNEIPFPFTESNGRDKMVANSIARIEEMGEKSKNHDRVYVYVNYATFEKVRPPEGAIVKELAKDGEDGETVEVTGYDVYLSLYDGTASAYLKHVIRYKMETFSSSMASFGCCDKYVQCSDAKKCLHTNPFYYRSCQYRQNLLAGKIFYGKNKNI